ncbi:MAG: hypothetical protein M0R73_02545 [Dehalococcoidia bacterium]|nr:hypothetical protein [Dehalococcoidia bacterium]
MASPGIYAIRQPAAAPGSSARQRSLGFDGRAELNRERARLGGEVRLNGMVGVLAAIAAVWAVDRYVLDVPFIRATGAKG